jgi:hypothetical protein
MALWAISLPAPKAAPCIRVDPRPPVPPNGPVLCWGADVDVGAGFGGGAVLLGRGRADAVERDAERDRDCVGLRANVGRAELRPPPKPPPPEFIFGIRLFWVFFVIFWGFTSSWHF